MTHEFEFKFKRKIQYEDVLLIEDFLKANNFRTMKKNQFESVRIYPEGYRKVNETFEKKTRINKPKHIVQMMKELEHEYSIKVTESNESRYVKIPYTESIMNRDRLRSTYKNKDFVCDISYIINTKQFEIELEVVSPKPSVKLIIDCLKILQKGQIFSHSEEKQVIRTLKTLTGGSIFPGALPFTIRKSQVEQGILACGYAMADKSDGDRIMMYINPKGMVYGIRRNREISKHFQIDSHFNSLFDCEKINDIFYVFDTIYFENKNVKDKSYIERLEFLKQIKHKQVKQKKIYLSSIKNFVDHVQNVEHETDGIIFTPIFRPYHNFNIYNGSQITLQNFLSKKLKISIDYTLPLKHRKQIKHIHTSHFLE